MTKRKGFILPVFLFLIFVGFMFLPDFLFKLEKKSGASRILPKILSMFSENAESGVSIVLTGDVMLGRTVEQKSWQLGDFTYPFKKTANFLKDADIVFVNLENPIVENCPQHSEGFKFCANPEMIAGLVFAGVDVVNLANNHTGNYGSDGIRETVKFLTDQGILSTGLDNLVIVDKNGTKFGFLGFDLTTKDFSDFQLELVQDSDAAVDVLLVGVHWGEEYKSVSNRTQKQTAKRLIEAGADVVVGHHPHWVQDIEYVDGKPIYYSLGNFVFDQMWSEETKIGLVIELTFGNGELVKEEKLPIYMSSWAQPEFEKK